MQSKLVIVLDCGATNVRSVAVDEKGKIIAQKSLPNNTQVDPSYSGGLIWDVEEIWEKLKTTTKAILAKIDKRTIVAVTVTTFGVDGATMSKTGEMLYPVISWACQRTQPVLDNMDKYISLDKLYSIAGVNVFSFNTINKLIWFKENKPDVLEQMEHFVFMPSLLIHKLCCEFVNDTTIAGTSMLCDIHNRKFSKEIFQTIGIDEKFPPMVEPGTIIGKIHESASKETGLQKNIPVVVCGHDTQFALFGSGVGENESVLRSGTWEILMARTPKEQTSKAFLEQGVTIEMDAVNGLFNPGIQWLGSGILEWIKKMFYHSEMDLPNIYETMIAEAEKASKGKLDFGIDFLNENGVIAGLRINAKREDIYRAALEALARKTKDSLEVLEKLGDFTAKSLVVVGGGSKNQLWNQLRANCLNIPVKLINHTETTVLGAAMFAFAGLGINNSPNEARQNVDYQWEYINPQ